MPTNLLRFGLSLDPDAAHAKDGVHLASAAEEAGLDYLAVQDHPYQAGHLDSWTWLMTYTDEALQALRPALAGDFVRLHGTQHRIEGHRAGPAPAAPVPAWLGAQGPRMLAVAGRHADGWVSPLNIYVTPNEVPTKQKIIDEAARAAGRDPATISRVYNVIGLIGRARGVPGLSGGVEQWADTLADWSTRLGFDTFIFSTAYAHRDAAVLVVGAVFAPSDRTTLDRIWRPVGAHTRGAYANFESRLDAAAFRRFYPGATGDRVLAMWRHHDPDGIFRSALYSGDLS